MGEEQSEEALKNRSEEAESSSEEPRVGDITETTPSNSNVTDEGGGATASGQSGQANEEEEEEGEEVWQRRQSLQASGNASQEDGAWSAEASGTTAESGQAAMETDGGSGKEQTCFSFVHLCFFFCVCLYVMQTCVCVLVFE